MIIYSHVRSPSWYAGTATNTEPMFTLDCNVRVATQEEIQRFLRSNALTERQNRWTTVDVCPDGADIAVLMMVSPHYLSQEKMGELLVGVAGGIEKALSHSDVPMRPRVFVGVRTWGFSDNSTVQVPAPELLTP